ncbi:hypothetical protein MJG53_018860 [Ovis ammon polii x Ovis aries]|uniref:Uncharacterized protein n=1 Tax=Ovis ammon polii x Ovis aries TaxID=2918886 RepID=A0ACB9U3I5_9CETA|nr:hypothetical protein MJG53_018860 [Ovis ammon polii x Ovis aries]
MNFGRGKLSLTLVLRSSSLVTCSHSPLQSINRFMKIYLLSTLLFRLLGDIGCSGNLNLRKPPKCLGTGCVSDHYSIRLVLSASFCTYQHFVQMTTCCAFGHIRRTSIDYAQFASVGGLPVSSVKNEKKQLFHQIDWLIVKTVDPMTSLHADTDVAYLALRVLSVGVIVSHVPYCENQLAFECAS